MIYDIIKKLNGPDRTERKRKNGWKGCDDDDDDNDDSDDDNEDSDNDDDDDVIFKGEKYPNFSTKLSGSGP